MQGFLSQKKNARLHTLVHSNRKRGLSVSPSNWGCAFEILTCFYWIFYLTLDFILFYLQVMMSAGTCTCDRNGAPERNGNDFHDRATELVDNHTSYGCVLMHIHLKIVISMTVQRNICSGLFNYFVPKINSIGFCLNNVCNFENMLPPPTRFTGLACI